MKTIPLEEALKLAVPGPRTAKFPHCTRAGGDEFRLFPHIEVPSMFGEPGRLIVNQGGYEIPTHDAHAALLAHFYNHGPELVRALESCLAERSKIAHIRARAILGDGEWTHNFYGPEEMEKLIWRVFAMGSPVTDKIHALLVKASTVQMP